MHKNTRPETRANTIVREIASWVVVIVTVALFFCCFRAFVGVAYGIPSGSMEDTLQVGDRVFAEKISFDLGEPSRGDIVTFVDPNDPTRTLIKRVVAVGGQTIDLRNGAVYIDGRPFDEPYADGRPTYPLVPESGVDISYPFTVPEKAIWVMGDNRTNSLDSRFFGPIPVSSVTGKAVFRSWPLSRFGPL